MKVMAYNHPKILIVPALMAIACAGFTQPLFGWIFSMFMKILTDPQAPITPGMTYETINILKESWRTNLEEETITLSIYTCYIAVGMFVGYMGKSYIFGYLGENVTMKVRQVLYKSILEKHIGFFDHQENQSSVLTSAMASETALVNGAASESLGPYTESIFALCGGLAIGFYFCW